MVFGLVVNLVLAILDDDERTWIHWFYVVHFFFHCGWWIVNFCYAQKEIKSRVWIHIRILSQNTQMDTRQHHWNRSAARRWEKNEKKWCFCFWYLVIINCKLLGKGILVWRRFLNNVGAIMFKWISKYGLENVETIARIHILARHLIIVGLSTLVCFFYGCAQLQNMYPR